METKIDELILKGKYVVYDLYRDFNQVALIHKTNTFQGHAKLNCSVFYQNLQEHQQWKL